MLLPNLTLSVLSKGTYGVGSSYRSQAKALHTFGVLPKAMPAQEAQSIRLKT